MKLQPLRTLSLDRPSRAGRPTYVSAASGLVRAGENLYVVADDENHLAVYGATGTQAGSLVRILGGDLPLEAEERKRTKGDLESVARLPPFHHHPHGALLAFGSGSKPNRCRAVLLALDAPGRLDGRRAEVDLAPLYLDLDRRVDGVNIEGALVLGEELVLLQRGNKGDGVNARVRLRLDHALAELADKHRLGARALIGIDEVDLGSAGGVPLGFTDGAALPDGRMVFTAVAEDTSDSYVDGACRGAAIGILGRKGKLKLLELIDPCHKVEGIEATLAGDVIDALLVTDADDIEVPATLLRCYLKTSRSSRM